MERLQIALLFSLLVHLVVAMGLALYTPAPPSNSSVIQIEIQSPRDQASRNETKQIVREALVPESMKVNESEDPLRFWSHQSQRVQKQTRAARLGLTQNRTGQRPESESEQASAKQKSRPNSRLLDREELMAAAHQAATSGGGLPALGSPGASTIGENLPEDVQIGSFTALNTDRYLYYTFFARVETLIRYRWESGVRNALDATPKEILAANIKSRWITQMEVLLNPKGEFVKVILLKQAGLPAFDQAAAMAFAEARLFPNPPAEMVEEDGFIHLKYSFTVYYDPRLMARP